jgi:hypothetical protein
VSRGRVSGGELSNFASSFPSTRDYVVSFLGLLWPYVSVWHLSFLSRSALGSGLFTFVVSICLRAYCEPMPARVAALLLVCLVVLL